MLHVFFYFRVLSSMYYFVLAIILGLSHTTPEVNLLEATTIVGTPALCYMCFSVLECYTTCNLLFRALVTPQQEFLY